MVDGLRIQRAFQDHALGAHGRIFADQPVLVVLSATEHRPGMRSAFFKDTKAVLATIADQPGLVGYAVRFEIFGRQAWTMTAWKDEASLAAFMRSPAHREAVRRSGETAQNIRFASVAMPLRALPMSWDEARRRLEAASPYASESKGRRP